MAAFFRFIAGPVERLIRAVAGLILIAVGLLWIHGVVGWVAAIIGLVPLAAGVFDQWGSITPGHPESHLTLGFETTRPMGQGFGNGVGMAIAEAHLATRYNRPDLEIVNHYTYGLVSDGDLMEGLASEAASLAGHLKLGKLIYTTTIASPSPARRISGLPRIARGVSKHMAGTSKPLRMAMT